MLLAMARILKPPRARLIVSVIHAHLDACADALRALERQFGRIVAETTDLPCANAQEYAEEMGSDLFRRFFCFDRLVERDSLAEAKAACHRIENQLGDRVHDFTFRAVNIDPGLLTADNLVMASHREFTHRVYLTNGVFAEVTLVCSQRGFVRLPWTPADFCHEDAISFFTRVRQSFQTTRELQGVV